LDWGLAYARPIITTFFTAKFKIDWFEAVSENYMGIDGGNGGNPLHILEKVRSQKPIALHGVSLNIGSTDPLNIDYLKKTQATC